MRPSWSFGRRLSARQLPAYSKFIAKVSKDYPGMLSDAIYLAAMGYHFEKITRQQIAIHDFLGFLRSELEVFQEAVSGRVSEEEIRTRSQTSLERAQSLQRSLSDEFRYREDGLDEALQSFRHTVAARTGDLAHSATAP